MLMTIEGSAQVRLRAAGDMNFAEGTLWSEGGAGTNAIGTAIALDHAVQVFGPEHFSDPVQRWTCSAAPIHDPDTGAVIGVIDLTGDLSTVHPHSLAVATATARAVEASLQLALQERDARLHARYGNRVAPDRSRADDAVRPRDRHRPARLGRRRPARDPARRRLARAARPASPRSPSPSPPRSRPSSCTPSSRAASRRIARPLVKLGFLGRDRATLEIDEPPHRAAPAPGRDPRAAVREPERDERRHAVRRPARRRRQRLQRARRGQSRLRKLLGPWIDTDRYRLTCDVETDVRRIEGLLAGGRVREAAEAYPGPLLPDLRGARRRSASASAWTRGCARP